MLKINPVKTDTIRIDVEGPGFSGFFKGTFPVRSKPENDALLKRHMEAVPEEGESVDENLIREIYSGFSDLTSDVTDDGFEYVLRGPYSAYLAPAALQAYFEQYQRARKGNSRGPRAR